MELLNYVHNFYDILYDPTVRFKCITGKAKEWTEEELDKTAEAVGYGAVK